METPEGSEVIVSQQTVTFQNKSDKQSYTITIKYKGHEKGEVSFGSLVWIKEKGNHNVRSPIVVSPRIKNVWNHLCYI